MYCWPKYFINSVSRAAFLYTMMCRCLQLSAAEITDAELAQLSRWDNTFNLKGWSGFRDNILFSNKDRVESPFVATGLDMLLWRLPENGWEVLVLGSGEYLRYLSAPRVQKEATAIGQLQVHKRLAKVWKLGMSAEYLYFDQVFDNSTVDRDARAVQVQAHTFTIRPSVRREFSNRYFGEVEASLSRQDFKSIVDDEWQVATKAALGWNLGTGSELSCGLQITDRQFDTREPRDARGLLVSGKSLEFTQHEAFASWRQTWDTAQHWRTVTRLNFQRNNDNDSGYYDYNRFRLSQQLRYTSSRWQVRAEAKLTYYQYDLQPVSSTDLSLRRKTIVQGTIRGERQLIGSLKAFAEFEHERSLSNLVPDAYRANTILAGLEWDF